MNFQMLKILPFAYFVKPSHIKLMLNIEPFIQQRNCMLWASMSTGEPDSTAIDLPCFQFKYKVLNWRSC